MRVGKMSVMRGERQEILASSMSGSVFRTLFRFFPRENERQARPDRHPIGGGKEYACALVNCGTAVYRAHVRRILIAIPTTSVPS